MASEVRRIDIDAAVLNPARYFARPSDVVHAPALSRANKRRILESWARDAELLSQAEAENMAGGDRPHLREARLALLELDDERGSAEPPES